VTTGGVRVDGVDSREARGLSDGHVDGIEATWSHEDAIAAATSSELSQKADKWRRERHDKAQKRDAAIHTLSRSM